MSIIPRTVLIPVVLLLLAATAGASGFQGLEPGSSCRGDVYRQLGKPLRTSDKGRICYFDPVPYKGKSVRAVFFKSGILRNIILEPGGSYSQKQYEKWFKLGPPSGHKEQGGARITLYDAEGIGLVHDGPSPDSPIREYVHYTDGSAKRDKRCNKLEDDFHDALSRDDCQGMLSAWKTGQKEFPKVSWFYIDEITWSVDCDPDFRKKTKRYVSLAQRGVELNPSAESYKFLAFVHVSITNDPAKALEAFRHISLKDYPELHAYVGGCYMELGNTAQAKKHFQAYLDKVPGGKLTKTAQSALKRLQ